MDGFNDAVESRIVRILNTYTEMQRKRYEYCPGVALHPSEIHAIECIALTNPINITELSRTLEMSKGGVSKCVDKLEKLGLVRRYKYMRNQKEVYLHLTELGVDAFKGHERYHQNMVESIEAYGRSLTEEQSREILRFLDTYLEQMSRLANGTPEITSSKKGE